MENSQKNPLEDLFSSVKSYMDLRLDEAKLNLAENMARIFSRIVFFLLFFILMGIVLGILSAALSIWLGELIGSSLLGMLATAGIILIAILILYLCRNRFLINGPLRMFIRMFFEDKKDGQEN